MSSRGNALVGVRGSAPGKSSVLHLENHERLSCRCSKYERHSTREHKRRERGRERGKGEGREEGKEEGRKRGKKREGRGEGRGKKEGKEEGEQDKDKGIYCITSLTNLPEHIPLQKSS